MLNKAKASECDSCGLSSSQEHTNTCTLPIFGTCDCKLVELSLSTLDFHGRKLELCPKCYTAEKQLMQKAEIGLHDYQKNLPDQIEHAVVKFKKTELTLSRWQEVYVTERDQWVLKNFSSLEEMKEKMVEFITSMEKLEWEIKTKRRAVIDSAMELDARLSKEERTALINDPNFKPASNSEFKKISRDREIDSTAKSLGLTGLTPQQMKAVDGLLKSGIDLKMVKEMLKLKDVS